MATQLIATPQEANKPRPHILREMRVSDPANLAIPLPVGRRNELFSETLLEMSSTRPQRRIGDVFMSVAIHVLVLLAVILPSLYFTDTIDLNKFTKTFLVGPPPPPPPPPMAQTVAKVVPAPRKILLNQGKLLAPVAIPQKVVIIKEEMPAPDLSGGVAGGVPGGVAGGQLGGVIGGIISGTAHTNVVAPPGPKVPMRVGGRIKPPRPISQPAPVYPILAKQTMLQGIVSIDAVIDEHGNVGEMHVVSGPPLLIPAALAAVQQWKYEPTFLNDQAIPVQLIVTVTFQLQR